MIVAGPPAAPALETQARHGRARGRAGGPSFRDAGRGGRPRAGCAPGAAAHGSVVDPRGGLQREPGGTGCAHAGDGPGRVRGRWALLLSCRHEAAKKMPSFSEGEEIQRHTEDARIVVKTGAASLAQNESNAGLAGMRVHMSARGNGEVLLSPLRLQQEYSGRDQCDREHSHSC